MNEGLQEYLESPWYDQLISFILGVLVVVFLAFLGRAIGESTTVVDISGPLLINMRMASVGLGTGYYLGASFRQEGSGETWFLFGVFLSLAVGAFITVDSTIDGQYPASSLLILGGLVSTIAHLTPTINETEEYIKMLKFIGGYATTIVVVFLSVADYLITLATEFSNWFDGLTSIYQWLVIALIIAIGIVGREIVVKINSELEEREIQSRVATEMKRQQMEERMEERSKDCE